MRRFISLVGAAALFVSLALPGVAQAEALAECSTGSSGSFNNDGFPDPVVGVPAANAVDVFYSRTGAPTRLTPAGLGQAGTQSDEFGAATYAFDVNGDYCYDLLIGSPGANGGAGRVTIVYGSPKGLVTSGVTVIESPDPSARFGSAFGWIHATTTSDSALLIGAPGYDDGAATDAGALYFYPLTSPGLGSASRVTQSSPGVDGDSTAGDNFGGVVADDLVGMPNKDVGAAADAGAVVKLVTTTGDPMTVRGISYTQNSPGVPGVAETGDHFGAALGVDYYAAVGVPGEDIGTKMDTGSVQVFRDADEELQVMQSIDQNTSGVPGANETGDRFGSAVVIGYFMARDDSIYQLWVGAPGENVGSIVDAGSITRIDLQADRRASSLTSGHGLPGKSEKGDQLGATLAGLRNYQIGADWEGTLSVLIGVPREDRGTAVDSGWVILADCWSWSKGLQPYSLNNKARTGEHYGQYLGRTLL